MIVRIIVTAFQFHFMALAINIIDRHSPSNEMHRQLQPKKTKVRLYYPFIYMAAKEILAALHTNKTKRVSFKSECVVRMAKHLKGDWFIVLRYKIIPLLKSFIANVLKNKANKI